MKLEVIVIARKKVSLTPILLSLIVAIAIGAAIGFVKFLFQDIIGFSLIIFFPLIYGIVIGIVLSLLFARFGLKSEKLAVIFSIISITVAIFVFMELERSHIEGLLLDYRAEAGEDVSDLYLTWEGYFNIIGETGTGIGFIVGPSIPITGPLFYALMLFEFGIMYYFAVKKVKELSYKYAQKHYTI